MIRKKEGIAQFRKRYSYLENGDNRKKRAVSSIGKKINNNITLYFDKTAEKRHFFLNQMFYKLHHKLDELFSTHKKLMTIIYKARAKHIRKLGSILASLHK